MEDESEMSQPLRMAYVGLPWLLGVLAMRDVIPPGAQPTDDQFITVLLVLVIALVLRLGIKSPHAKIANTFIARLASGAMLVIITVASGLA